MRKMMTWLVVILAAQLGLAAALAMRKNPLAATTPDTPLINTSLEQVDRIVIEGHAAAGASGQPMRVVLSKQPDGQWVLPDYFNAPVDKFRLSSMLSEISALKRGLPIATSSSALKRFRLVDDNFERRLAFSHGNRALSTIYIGSSSGVRKSDARTSSDHAVYNVDLASYELPTTPSDWLDADVLQRNPSSLTELDITGTAGQPNLKLVRRTQAPTANPSGTAQPASASASAPTAQVRLSSASTAHAKLQQASLQSPSAQNSAPQSGSAPGAAAWVDPTLPSDHHIDTARADSLAREVAELHVQAVLGLTAKPEWQQDHPLLVLRIGDDKHPGQLATWTLSKPGSSTGVTPAKQPLKGSSRSSATSPSSASLASGSDDYYVLKDSAQPWYFQVSSAAGKQLLDDSSPQLLAVADRPGKPSAHASTTSTTARARRSSALHRAAPTGSAGA